MIEQIHNAYDTLLKFGVHAKPRGETTVELLAMSLEFSEHDWFIDYPSLPISYDYVREEMKWYLAGRRDDLSIREHATIWDKCVDKNGLIQSNYGHYFLDQVDHVVSLLTNDPESRRAVININRPEHSYIDAPDVPCTVYFNFMIRDGKLNMHVHMRSQDAVFGLRNDLPAFQMFKLLVSDMLEMPPGRLYLMVDSFHVYARHTNKMYATLSETMNNTPSFTDAEDLHKWIYRE
jgi:thymidylate synthase